MVAALRARATARTDRICEDPWAARLAGADGDALAAFFLAGAPHLELWLAVRTAVLDDLARRAMATGVRQVVLLGAGLDTRAARLRAAGVRFFEVDRAGTQGAKLDRLKALGDYPIDAATYVSCDFEREDFLDRLQGAGLGTDATLFLWEGVTCYLTEAAVRATLSRIARGCHPASVVAFDYVGKKLVTGAATDAAGQATAERVAGLLEPLRWGTNDVLPLLYEEGFRRVRTTSFDEACLRLTGTYARDRLFRFQHLAAASVSSNLSL